MQLLGFFAGLILGFYHIQGLCGADLYAFFTGDAFFLIVIYSHKGEIAGRLQKYCNRTKILTEGSVILEIVGQENSNGIVEEIARHKTPENYLLQVFYA